MDHILDWFYHGGVAVIWLGGLGFQGNLQLGGVGHRTKGYATPLLGGGVNKVQKYRVIANETILISWGSHTAGRWFEPAVRDGGGGRKVMKHK